jgi:hypothetical protein
MVFIFLLYSTLATAIQELIATLVKMRGRYLRGAVARLLEDLHLKKQLVRDFEAHPLIQKINAKRGKGFPSYLKPETFSIVVQDILPDVYLGKGRTLTPEEKLRLMPDGNLKRALFTYINTRRFDMDEALRELFDSAMERLSGRYKRRTQYNVFIIGAVLAIGFNVDAIAVFNKLSKDDKARERLVNRAVAFAEANQNYDSLMAKYRSQAVAGDSVKQGSKTDSLKNATREDSLLQKFNEQRMAIKQLLDSDLADVNNTIGIGWRTAPVKINKQMFNNGFWPKLLLMSLGWFITALAVTIGAPFWFDLLQKLVRIRGTGSRPLTETEKQKLLLKNS